MSNSPKTRAYWVRPEPDEPKPQNPKIINQYIMCETCSQAYRNKRSMRDEASLAARMETSFLKCSQCGETIIMKPVEG